MFLKGISASIPELKFSLINGLSPMTEAQNFHYFNLFDLIFFVFGSSRVYFFNMQTVYLVYRRAFDKCKLGFTIDLPFRLLSPNELRISNRRSWKVIYTEKFEAKKAAM